jgi:hypothetical protein
MDETTDSSSPLGKARKDPRDLILTLALFAALLLRVICS